MREIANTLDTSLLCVRVPLALECCGQQCIQHAKASRRGGRKRIAIMRLAGTKWTKYRGLTRRGWTAPDIGSDSGYHPCSWIFKRSAPNRCI